MMLKPLFSAAINGLLVVALGAFGAHALETHLDAAMLDVWQTAVQYQMFHTLGLIALALLQREQGDSAALDIIGHCFIAGIVLFCGSLYLLALTGLRWLGTVTPIGGVLFLVAWLQLALTCYRWRKP